MINSQLSSTVKPRFHRPRRLRHSAGLRRMVRETHLSPDDFIFPLFITHGQGVREPIPSMPGISRLSIDQLAAEIEEINRLNIPAVLLFGIPASKDLIGLENFSSNGIVQQAIREIKSVCPDMVVISDICLCEYTAHGHCGLLSTPEHYPHLPEGTVLNDETLGILVAASVSHAQAGADIIAPSGMMDGMVEAIRTGLDSHDFTHIPIMSYAVKYASAFYGPFRDAADGAPQFGDRKSHQMDPANAREALREAALDVAEGTDFLMVKPGLPYLDVVSSLRHHFSDHPIVAYNVSGEYAMVKAAAQNGWLDEKRVVLETMLSFKRAGADLIITYHAKEAANWLQED